MVISSIDMSFAEKIPANAKIIEIEPQSPDLGDLLIQSGFNNYLGLTSNVNTLHEVQTESSKLSISYCELRSRKQIFHNNANVLVFSGWSATFLLDHDNYRHAEFLIISPVGLKSLFITLPLWLLRLCRSQLRLEHFTSFINSHGKRQYLITFRVPKPTGSYASCYISPKIGVQGFFDILNQNEIEYVVLRWFEKLPCIEADDDIDILVEDRDFDRIRELLTNKVGLIPVDVYTTSGIPGSDYLGMAYYPPDIARKILREREFYSNSFYIPNPENHFLSLAYHAVYHKGFRSGLPARIEEMKSQQILENKYYSTLSHLASRLGIKAGLTLDGLDKYLEQKGWSPPVDTLSRYGFHNEWVAEWCENRDIDISNGEVIVHILREYATKNNLENEIIKLLEFYGLEVILTKKLSTVEKQIAAKEIRGGNWERWNAKEDPGGPTQLIVAYDYNPSPLPQIDKRYPLVKNRHFFIKHIIRDHFSPDLPVDQQINLIHSSDNEWIAWDYIKKIIPTQVQELKTQIQKKREGYKTKEKVLSRLPSQGAHSKVEVIEFRGGKAVKKTYTPIHKRFLEREKFVMRKFSHECEAIPPLLGEGDNYIIYPYYEDRLRYAERNPIIISPKTAKAALDILRFFFDKGYALIDFHPKNVIYDKKNGFKFIDFEYLYKYKVTPVSFDQSYDIIGIPDDFDGDRVPGAAPDVTYEKFWKPHIRSPVQRSVTFLKKVIRKLFAKAYRILLSLITKLVKKLFTAFYSPYLKKMKYFEEMDDHDASSVS